MLNNSKAKITSTFLSLIYIASISICLCLIKIPEVSAQTTTNGINISCVANAPIYFENKRIYTFYDSAGRYCKSFVDMSTRESGYDLRYIYNQNHQLYIYANFDLANRGRLRFEIVYDTSTGNPKQYIKFEYPTSDTAIQTNLIPSVNGLIVNSKFTSVGGILKKAEEYLNGRLNSQTIYTTKTELEKTSTIATTYDVFNRITNIAITTPYSKTESISNLDPGILDYLDNTIPVTIINTFDPITGIRKTRTQQIKTAAGIVAQLNVLDPSGQLSGSISRRYYDPFLGYNYSNVNVANGPIRNGYSLTYNYNEEQLRKIRRQQLAVGEIYSDLASRTNYTADWYNYPAPSASAPCPGSTSTERCLNVDLRDLFKKELDLVVTLPPQRKKHVITFIGDSITFQRPPGYPIARDGDIYLNQGIPGDGTTQIYNRLNIIQRNDVAIDGVLLLVGINNFTGIFQGQTAPTIDQVNTLSSEISFNISRVVQKIHEYQPNAKVFILSVTPVSIPKNVKWLRTEHIAVLNKKISETIQALSLSWSGLSYHDIGNVLLDSTKNGDPKYLQADGLHLNLQGQSRTGQVIKGIIESQLP